MLCAARKCPRYCPRAKYVRSHCRCSESERQAIVRRGVNRTMRSLTIGGALGFKWSCTRRRVRSGPGATLRTNVCPTACAPTLLVLAPDPPTNTIPPPQSHFYRVPYRSPPQNHTENRRRLDSRWLTSTTSSSPSLAATKTMKSRRAKREYLPLTCCLAPISPRCVLQSSRLLPHHHSTLHDTRPPFAP